MTYRVFLSSTARDLEAHRAAVIEALRTREDIEVVCMEDFVAKSETPRAYLDDRVRDCQILVGLVAHCYGSAPPKRKTSFTEREYQIAVKAGIPCLMHVAPEGAKLPTHREDDATNQRLLKFRRRLQRAHIAPGEMATWNDPAKLATLVLSAVTQQIDTLKKASPAVLTKEAYATRLTSRQAQIAALLAEENADTQTLLAEKAELERRIGDLDASFDAAKQRIADLEALLEREGNVLGAERLDLAETALKAGDFDAADALLAEIEADEDLAVKRAARAAYGRGKIAEEQVRWHDAADHYGKAARLDPTVQNLRSATEFCWRAGDYPKAEALGTEMMRIAHTEHGDRSREFSAALNDHALTLQWMGRHAEAEPILRQAIDIDRATIGERHPNFAIRLNNLALLLRDMGRLEEAEPLYRQAIDIDKASTGERHQDHATRLNNLAGLLRAMGRLEEAEPIYRQAIDISRATIGEQHPDYATGLNNLANMLREMARLEEAEPLQRKAIEIAKATIGTRHPDYAIHLNNLAGLLRAMGHLCEAEPILRQAIDIDKATIGERHPEHARHVHNLATLVAQAGRHDEARGLHARALEISLATSTAAHPNTRTSAQNYADLLRTHFPDDPALKDLQQTFGPDIGTSAFTP
ncbi:MAG: tetratricopeptide repeat protein [Pseudomonadota bacterium]